MGERIKLTSGDGFTFNAYRAEPAGKAKGAVVLIHEVWGLNNFVRSEVDRYAGEGYVTVAPALMDRIEPGYESEDYGPTGFAKIGELLQGFNPASTLPDVEAAVASVTEAGKVGITGYCFGGAISWRSAHAGLGLAAASGYYGGGVPNYIGLAPQIPIEMHFGDNDSGIPLEQIEALRQAYPDVPVYLYPAGHGFCNFDRPSSHDTASSKLANERTLAFFGQHLV
ncbi:dienelactone hydrolase family protein [uncultured Devosia sp.]|uniref:dienelactone hydrolase family protein n=1 Tax=uncultured Devosia sp. TaxID=211434 RepID=UPI0035CA2F64